MDNQKRNYIISGVAAVAIALIGFFFYNSNNTEVVVTDNTDNADMEVVVVAQSGADRGAEETTGDKSETVPAIETTEAASTADATEE